MRTTLTLGTQAAASLVSFLVCTGQDFTHTKVMPNTHEIAIDDNSVVKVVKKYLEEHDLNAHISAKAGK